MRARGTKVQEEVRMAFDHCLHGLVLGRVVDSNVMSRAGKMHAMGVFEARCIQQSIQQS